ncbi:hypothetical protein D6Z43_09820 [Pseudomonas sp. DY-1]|uniref:hypothetical protein n=1 Tax=Pseudomonas sp. DY-1 TaxID=1755504 RepID=UPI000EA9E397|nr:hypothetical protein [Pseudomonas sp. DY-1]AYF87433.1 hypothetical protein D6Z43_09820 [Pseudomonas sp. DY-1]
MRTKLDSRLQGRLSALLPGHIVKCSFASDGVVGAAIDNPATGESWWITGIAKQSLTGKEPLEETVDQLLVEIRALRGEEVPLLLAVEESSALK